MTHPFHHDLRGRGFGLAKHPGSGFGHDFRGWEFYNNTRIAYGTVDIGGQDSKVIRLDQGGAVRDFMLKAKGFDAASEFIARHSRLMQRQSGGE